MSKPAGPARMSPDQAIRNVALDVGRSFIVRAPAGSGKTRLLIQRYLALLSCVAEPEEVIAITFTRKAAAEMRERVLAAFASADDPAAEGDGTTRIFAKAVLARSDERGWQLASNVSRLRIQTIDALNASITRQMPLSSRFGAQPQSVDDAGALYLEAARMLLSEINAAGTHADDIATLLSHLDNNLAVAETLLAAMLRARDHWLRNLPAMREREVLESALAAVRARAVAAAAALFPRQAREETLHLARFAAGHLPAGKADAGIAALASVTDWLDDSESAVAGWLALADFLLTQSGAWRKQKGLNKNLGFPTSSDRQEKTLLDVAKARMGALLEQLESGPDGTQLAAALDRLRILPPPGYTEAQWEILGAIVRLLPQATGFLWTVFGAHAQCDFSEIAQSASRALGSDEAPTDLALAMDYRIRHLLVDEFQDTSFAQFELLEKLTRGWVPGDGRTLFLVGDPMQSIYRFREAEVGLFLRAMKYGIGDIQLEPLTLTVNFRSVPGIVGWVNEAFAQVMPQSENVAAGQVPYAASEACQPVVVCDRQAVAWYPQFIHPAEPDAADGELPSAGKAEAKSVIDIIRQARADMPAGQIALLVRNRNHLADIVPALRDAGIAYRAVDIDPLQEASVVQDLLMLVRAIVHLADRIAWLALLRAPCCGITLADLAALTGGAEANAGELATDSRTVWELLGDDARMSAITADGRARLSNFRAVMLPILKRRRRMPLRDLVENAWMVLHGPACLSGDRDLDDAMRMLDLLEAESAAQTGGHDLVDLELFATRIAKLYAGNQPPTDVLLPLPVQIMTIHKAKGLEFDTVIVPSLHRVPRNEDRGLLAWNEQADPATGERMLLLAPIREAGAADDDDAIYRFVQLRERERQQHEDVRLLYVAATRAKQQLHLLATVAVKVEAGEAQVVAPRAMSLLAALWPVAGPVFTGALAALPSRGELPAIQRTLKPSSVAPRRLPSGFLAPATLPPAVISSAPAAIQPIARVDFEWAGETARHVGTVVHDFLRQIAEQGLATWSVARISQSKHLFELELRRLGVDAAARPEAARRVETALINTVEDERGRWLLGEQMEAKSEWRLTGHTEGSVVNIAIDRTFVADDGTRWIIDYKTGEHKGGNLDVFLNNEVLRYRQQIETYAALLHRFQISRIQSPIRLGLYFPMLAGWREWRWES